MDLLVTHIGLPANT